MEYLSLNRDVFYMEIMFSNIQKNTGDIKENAGKFWPSLQKDTQLVNMDNTKNAYL